MPEFVLNRRQALTGAAVAAGALVVAGGPSVSAEPESAQTADPFLLGVASGDPLPDGVMLWTRLVRDPGVAASMGRRSVLVGWQVAEDERFHRVVREGIAIARPELAHSVHVDVRGLRPGHEYFYRFRTTQQLPLGSLRSRDRASASSRLSPVGRTRTAPSPWASPDTLRLGMVSCQDFQNGYWPAYLGLAAEDVDVVLHLGDYIYEYDPHSRFPDRNHSTPATLGLDQLRTLDDYRARHAQYKGDPALRAAHANSAWVPTWDDHEVENNYANLVDEIDDVGPQRQTPEEFAAQRAAAYQAYYEHLPIRVAIRPGSSSVRIYRRFDFGRLARINVLDTRQYRTDQPGGFPGDLGPEPPGAGNTAGTLTGAEQQHWLDDGLTGSHARWNVIAQQVMMARTRFPNPAQVPPTIVNLDQWDGYQPARTRFLQFLADAKVPNPVVLAGDIHSTWINELRPNFDDPAAPPVAVEFVGTSVSSDFPVAFDAPIKQFNPILNPHVKYFDGLKRGYLTCEVSRGTWRTDVRVVDTIDRRDAPTTTAASFVVEAGHSVIHRT
jgi:alkaline phosphatase D